MQHMSMSKHNFQMGAEFYNTLLKEDEKELVQAFRKMRGACSSNGGTRKGKIAIAQ